METSHPKTAPGTRRVARFDSVTPEYTRAFLTFLAHTDQKEKALEWLEREAGALARRDTVIDAGAGTGKLTAWIAPRFRKVIAVEPNPSLAAEFRATVSDEIVRTNAGSTAHDLPRPGVAVEIGVLDYTSVREAHQDSRVMPE